MAEKVKSCCRLTKVSADCPLKPVQTAVEAGADYIGLSCTKQTASERWSKLGSWPQRIPKEEVQKSVFCIPTRKKVEQLAKLWAWT